MLNFHIFNAQILQEKLNNVINPNSETIVFLHGNSGSLFDGGPLANSFNNSGYNYQFIGIDLPGHGDSDSLIEYNLSDMATEVAETINSLELKSFHLLGHSLGGHVLINALDLLNRKAKSISLIGTPPIRPKTSFNEFFYTLKESQVLFTNKVNYDELENYFKVAFDNLKRPSESKLFKSFKDSFLLTDLKFRESFLSSLGSGKLKDELNILNCQDCPISFLVGSHDPLINKNWVSKCAKELNSSGKDSKVIEVKTAFHYPHLSNPHLVKDILLELYNFLNHPLPNEFRIKKETGNHSSPNA